VAVQQLHSSVPVIVAAHGVLVSVLSSQILSSELHPTCPLQGVAVTSSGKIYVAEANSNVIRVINTDGSVATIAGDGSYGCNAGTPGGCRRT
jgi:DNA-binding beta-propeller fold protein YncE